MQRPVARRLRVSLEDDGRHRSNHGYGRVAQSVLRALIAFPDCDVVVRAGDARQREETDAIAGLEGGVSFADGNERCDVSFHVGPPNSVKAKADRSIAFTMTDVDGLPPTWVDALQGLDIAVTPSVASANAMRRHLGMPVEVVPLYSDATLFKPQEHRRAEGPNLFSLIFMGTFSYRKNVETLLRAFYREFTVDEAALTLFCSETSGDRVYNETMRIMREERSLAHVRIITQHLSDAWVARTYAQHDAFVSVTRGEGFGYPALEAALCGRPMIVPESTGIDEIAVREASIVVPTSLRSIDEDQNPAGGNFRKAYAGSALNYRDVDIATLREGLRRGFVERESLRRAAMAAVPDLRSTFSRERFDAEIGRIMTDLLDAPRAATDRPGRSAPPEATRANTYARDETPTSAGKTSDMTQATSNTLSNTPATSQGDADGEKLRLEIGSGDKPKPGFVHHDVRELPGIDVICDARAFPPEHFGRYDEVYASNVIEHFNRFEVKDVIKHWAKLLKVGGILHLITPDMQEITRQYVDKLITHDQFVYLCYGGNDYEYNRHYYAFSVEHMVLLFKQCGLATVRCDPGKPWGQKRDEFYCPMIVAKGMKMADPSLVHSA